MRNSRSLRLLLALAGVGALAVVALGGGAATAGTSSKGATVIKMDRKGAELSFTGPPTVAAGTNLKIKNMTNPRRVGSHTFSLVSPDVLPTSRKRMKACAERLKGICGAVVEWHDIDVRSGQVRENPVEVGKQGWERQGNLTRKGDSWVAERRGQAFTRTVTAKPGKTLHFLCAAHPEMQGEIEVVE